MDIDFKWLLRQQADWDYKGDEDDGVLVSAVGSAGKHIGWWPRNDNVDVDDLLTAQHCIVWWADNTFELLSRDEEERRLFATLLELER